MKLVFALSCEFYHVITQFKPYHQTLYNNGGCMNCKYFDKLDYGTVIDFEAFLEKYGNGILSYS